MNDYKHYQSLYSLYYYLYQQNTIHNTHINTKTFSSMENKMTIDVFFTKVNVEHFMN